MGVLPSESYFKYFEEICAIPHGSRELDNIANYIERFAREHNLDYSRDEANNVVIYSPSNNGVNETVILQGHMDMVCEKTADSNHDFTNDGLRLFVDGDLIGAKDTTLGGDDGIAVAYMLAILEDDSIKHPNLECVFTTDEEIGMLGATAFDTSKLKGKYLLNIDSEIEGIMTYGCAGGVTTSCNRAFELVSCSPDMVGLEIKIHGMKGGHSGICIIEKGANADKELAKILRELSSKISFGLAHVEGGLKDNAIPNLAVAKIMVDKFYVPAIKEFMQASASKLSEYYSYVDPEIVIDVTECAVMPYIKDTASAIALIDDMPNGIQAMNPEIEGLVQTSLNLGILNTESRVYGEAVGLDEDGSPLSAGIAKIIFSFSVRSSVAAEKEALVRKIESVAMGYKAVTRCEGEYPAWEFKADSPLRNLAKETYFEMYGEEPKEDVIHAGLECGIFSSKMPDTFMVSYGPNLTDIHTANERLSISSARRVWEFTLRLLEKIR